MSRVGDNGLGQCGCGGCKRVHGRGEPLVVHDRAHGVVPLKRVEKRLVRGRGLVDVQLRRRQRLDP